MKTLFVVMLTSATMVPALCHADLEEMGAATSQSSANAGVNPSTGSGAGTGDPRADAKNVTPHQVWTSYYHCKGHSGAYAFEGHVNVRYERTGYRVTATAEDYKIWRNNNSAGNHANIHMDFVVEDENQGRQRSFGTTDSPDSMMQDNTWRPLNLSLGGDAGYTPKYFNAGVKFTFDAPSQSDPSCWAEHWEYFD